MKNGIFSSRGNALAARPFAMFCSVLALAAMCSSAHAQTKNPPAQPPDSKHPTGQYAVTMEEDPGIPDHTVYRPADLAALPKQELLPIVAFSGPGCDFNGTAFRPFFTEVASYGYLVVVSGPPEPRGGSGPSFPKTKASDLVASIDWAIAENGRHGSKYYDRLDPHKVALMGQSCGGLQAMSIASDPRIAAIVMWNSGIFNAPPKLPPGATANLPGMSLFNLSKDLLKTIHVPMAYSWEEPTWRGPMRRTISTASIKLRCFWAFSIFRATLMPEHIERKMAGSWGCRRGLAELALQGRPDRGTHVSGKDCGLCTDPQWTVQKKNID